MKNFPKSRPGGFSLVEIMVALVVGMIGILVIMQVARTGEAQKRVTSGSGDAHNNAALGIYSVERDIRQAGYGFSSLNVVGCQLNIPARDPLPAFSLDVLAPISINSSNVPAGDSGTDTLLIVYGNSTGSPEGDVVTQASTVSGTQHLGLISAINFQPNEWVVATPPIPTAGCALNLRQVQNVYPECPAGTAKKDCPQPTTVVVPATVNAEDDGQLFDFGRSPRIIGYAVRGGNLTSCDYMQTNCSEAANWTAIANGIVSLRAQYSAAGGYQQAMPSLEGDDQEAFAGKLSFSSLRFALVSRNGEWNRDAVSAAAPTWAGSPTEDGDGVAIDLAANTDWQHYRYQVFETVVPLRNIPWMGS